MSDYKDIINQAKNQGIDLQAINNKNPQQKVTEALTEGRLDALMQIVMDVWGKNDPYDNADELMEEMEEYDFEIDSATMEELLEALQDDEAEEKENSEPKAAKPKAIKKTPANAKNSGKKAA